MSRRTVCSVAMLVVGLASCTEDRPAPAPSTGAGPVPVPVDVPPASGRVTSIDALANVPTFMWADPNMPVLAPRPASAGDAARQHVARFASHYRLTREQVAALELRHLHDTGRGVIIAQFVRRVDGVEVFGEQLSVAMNRAFDVIALSGFVTGDLPSMAKLGVQGPGGSRLGFLLGTTRAMTAAMTDLAGVALDATDFEAPTAGAAGFQVFRLRDASAARARAAARAEPTRGKPVFYRLASDALVPAYYVEADLGNDAARNPRSFSYLIAADDGRVLSKNDLTAYESPVTYRVYADASGLFMPWDGPQGTAVTPHPTGLPDGFQPELVPAQLVTLSSLAAVGVNDPWLPEGATETLGNNVDAYLDVAPPDGFTPGGTDLRGTITAPNTFADLFDPLSNANASSTQKNAAITQLFYNDNWFHDWYYAAGFTEAAGNAQFSNYGRGGVEGDGLRAEAQDGSGMDNANMATPADGGRPRMQMFLWNKLAELKLTVSAPATLAGTFTNINSSSFAPANFNLTASIVQANPTDGCTPLVGDYAGKIVVVDRGGSVACNGFAGKAERVQAAGGVGVIIANVATSANPTVAPAMGGTPTVPITIAAVSLNLADGDRFRAAFAAGSAVTGSLVRRIQLLDGDLDNQIVAHEWGHYISNRLVFNSAGLQTNMARGLGEGWADFHAMLITVREEDTASPGNDQWQGTYGVGNYATSNDPNSYYFGIRRYPYSTDVSKNPLTFKHISDMNPLPVSPAPHFIAPNSEVHNTGEIWAEMLWECYAGLLRATQDTQGSSARLTFAQARDRMRDYLVAAYKLTPANPTLLEARDAVLLAMLAGDAADYQACGAAFARRGAGINAVAPPRGEGSNTPVVESFVFGPAVQQTGATLVDDGSAVCTADKILDDGETGTLRVSFRNVGSADTPALTATVSSTTPGITFPDGPTLTVPAILRAGTADATIRVSAAGLAPNADIVISVGTPDAGAGEASPVSYRFAGNADEIAGQSNIDTAERSTFLWAQASSVPAPPADILWTKVSTSSTNHVYRCRAASVAASVDLISPPLVIPTGQTLALAFSHRFSFERDGVNNLNFDGGVIEVSTDEGVTWVDVFTLPGAGVAYNGLLAAGNPLMGRPAFTGTSAAYPAFVPAALNLGGSFGGKLVRLRFRVASDPALASPGWEIDNIQITGTAAPLFAGLVAQPATCNRQPVASAGGGQTVPEFGPGPGFVPVTVFLDGSASLDPDGNPLTYRWTQVSGPAVVLSDPAARIPSFLTPQVPRTPTATTLIFQLVVNDGSVASAARFTAVAVSNVNRPPVARAGAPQTVAERALVTLDGSGSSDPDAGDPALTFSWTAPAGIVLSGPTTARPTFVAPDVSASTPFTFTLTVSDGLAASASSSVTITVNNVNAAPVASAGDNQTVAERSLVTLDGRASRDPDGDPLNYQWTAPAGVTLDNATTAQPTFIAPDVGPAGATFTFSLVVSDPSNATSAAATVVVTVTNVNRGPTASAGGNRTVGERTTVMLDGSASSDPDGDPLSYEWVAPAGITLSNPTAARPTFTAPEVGPAGATFRFVLVVRDPFNVASPAATVDITVTDVNRAPLANAGPDVSVRGATIVTLAGSGTDADADRVTFKWTAPREILLFGGTTATPFFVAPDVRVDTPFTFSLVVTDARGLSSAPDAVVVTVRRRGR